MASIMMRRNGDGSRVFRIRCKVNDTVYQRTYPAKDEEPIPDSWSDKHARKEAEKVASLFEDACRHSKVSSDKRTLYEYAQYVIDLKQKTNTIKPSTAAGYTTIMNRIKVDPIGKIQVRELTPQDLNEFYSRLMSDGANLKTKKPLAPKTAREYHALISSVLTQAMTERIITIDPSERAMVPTIEQKPAEFYPPERMEKIIDAVSQEPVFWQAMTYLFIGIGARRGEILALKWDDIDFTENKIFIRRNMTRADKGRIVIVTPKTNRWRIVSIAPELLAPLKKWKIEQEEALGYTPIDAFCFSKTDPKVTIRPDSVTRYYAKLAERYHLDHIMPKAFRHSQASIILKNGDIMNAAHRLGHSKASTTMNIYGHMMPTADKTAAGEVESAFFKKVNSAKEGAKIQPGGRSDF